CRQMREEADGLVKKLCDDLEEDPHAQSELRQRLYESWVEPFLDEPFPEGTPLADPLKAQEAFAHVRSVVGNRDKDGRLDTIERLCHERRQLIEQARVQRWLTTWRLLHIPCSVVLLVLAAVHIYTALKY